MEWDVRHPIIKKSFEPCECGNDYFQKGREYKAGKTFNNFRRHKFTCMSCQDQTYSEWVPFHYPSGLSDTRWP